MYMRRLGDIGKCLSELAEVSDTSGAKDAALTATNLLLNLLSDLRAHGLLKRK
jgi:hypothetical protein